jgi:hypothetical protein
MPALGGDQQPAEAQAHIFEIRFVKSPIRLGLLEDGGHFPNYKIFNPFSGFPSEVGLIKEENT